MGIQSALSTCSHIRLAELVSQTASEPTLYIPGERGYTPKIKSKKSSISRKIIADI
jgi:hypothetical protein